MENKIQLAVITSVPDTDENYPLQGNLYAEFNQEELKSYVQRFGHSALCENLARLQYQVIAITKTISDQAFAKESELSNG